MRYWLRNSTSALLLTRPTTQAWERWGSTYTLSTTILICFTVLTQFLQKWFFFFFSFAKIIVYTWEYTSFGILIHLHRLTMSLWFLGLISCWFFSRFAGSFPFLYFFSVFLSWHFLAPEMNLNRHVLLFSFCFQRSEVHMQQCFPYIRYIVAHCHYQMLSAGNNTAHAQYQWVIYAFTHAVWAWQHSALSWNSFESLKSLWNPSKPSHSLLLQVVANAVIAELVNRAEKNKQH